MRYVKILSGLLFVCAFVQAKQYNVLDFGASPNSGIIHTDAFQKAVDACSQNGGGRVVVPCGSYITGTIILKSNVDLHLEQGAVLVGSRNKEDYYSTFCQHGILFCEDAENVSLTGKGMIDAQGRFFFNFKRNHLYDEFDKSATRQKEQYMPEGSFFSDGPVLNLGRPGIGISFFHCSKVAIEGITIKDTPNWAVRIAYSDDVLIHGVSIKNSLLIPNSDGFHCTVSRNIRMSDCDIRAGDDAFIVTGFSKDDAQAGYTMEEQSRYTFGNKTPYAENVTVNNCVFQSASSGIRIGYGQHPVRNCVFSNIVIYDSNRGIGIFAHDSSDISNLIFSNIVISTRLFNGQWWGNGEPIHLSCMSRFEGIPAGQIKDVQFNNIIATAEHGILLYGLPDSPISNVSFTNVSIRINKGKETLAYGGNFDLRPVADRKKQVFEHDIPGVYAQYVNGLSFRDFHLKWGTDLPAFFTHGIECYMVTDLSCSETDSSPNPNCPTGQRIHARRTSIAKQPATRR
jgi:hypothetical protein